MKAFKIIQLLIIATTIAGCGGLTGGEAASEKAIDHFHELYNQGNLEQIWQEATPEFRNSSTKAKYDEFLGAVYRKLGKVSTTSNGGSKVQVLNTEITVFMNQNTFYEHGQGIESFSFKIDGAKASLFGYNIQSDSLDKK